MKESAGVCGEQLVFKEATILDDTKDWKILTFLERF